MSTFFTRQDYSLGTMAVDLSIADLNGDGKLDLVVTSLGTTAKLLVLTGDGAGGFTTTTNLDVTNDGTSMGFAAVADMDGDGDLDVVYDSYYNYSIRVMFRDSAGDYQAGTPVNFGSRPMSMTVGDVNGDGKKDVVALHQSGALTILLNDGQGGFQTPITNTSIQYRYASNITMADMNGDGKLDIVAASNSNNIVSVLLGDGAGGFTLVTGYGTGSRLPSFATVGDVNGDGKLDVLTANLNGTVSVLLGNGAGGFTSLTDVSVGSNPQSLALADLNGDGKLDLVAAISNSNSVAVRWGDGAGNFSSGTDIAVGAYPRTVKVADVNQDGRMDIVVTGLTGNTVTVLLGGERTNVTAITASGSGTLKTGDTITFTLTTDNPVTVTGTPELVLSNGAHAVYAGLDSNGRPTFTYTVVEGDTGTSNLAITGIDSTDGSVSGLTEVSFATPIGIVSGNGIQLDVATVDVNGDGKLDLVMAEAYMSTVSVLLGDGTGNFSSPTRLPVGLLASAIATGDINGDGKLDMLTTNTGDSTVSVRLGDGAGNFSSPADVSVENSVVTIALGDVNGDGKLDMLTGGGGIAVRLGDGAGGFSSPTSVLSSGSGAVFADVNRDGKLDVVASTGTAVAVMLGDGAGNFSSPGFVSVSSPLLHVTVMDLNGDGNVDLLSHGNSNKVSVRLGNGAGGFSGSTQLVFGDTVFDIAVGDVNGDGKIDVVAANDGNVSVRLGDGAGNFSSSTDISVDDSVQVVNLADVNDDGKLDILASYNGTTWVLLNTSHGSSSFDGATITTADGVHSGRGVDASRPDAPDLALTNDNGSSSTDFLTNDGSLTIGKETDATLTYVIDGGAASTTYDPTALADGEHTVEVRQTDAAGNVSAAGSITFTLDRSAPDAVTLALTSDTGTSPSDKRTTDGTVTISGKETGATLSYVIDGGEASTTYDPDALADGEHTIEITQTDAAGNVSDTRSLTFTLDRTALAPVLALSSDTGASSSDNVTKSSGALTVTGVETGASLSYVVDGGEASATYDPTALEDGEHTVEIRQTDMAGNVSSAGTITFALDRASPIAPTLALTSDTGTSSTDHVTKSGGALTVTGVETGASLSYVVDGGEASATYDPTALEDGEHTVEIRQTDIAGNVSSAGTITFTLDRAAAAPTVVLAHDTGTSSTDGLTNNGSLTITGVESGATLSYIVNGGEASATYDPSTFDDGHYTVKVLQTDAAGNVSLAGSVSFTYDLSIGSPEPYLANDNGSASNDFVTNDGSLDIAGVEEGSTLSYVIDGGTPSATYDPSALADGEHTIGIKQTDAAGNTSYFYGSITFTLDRSAPDAVVLALASDTGKSATDKITSNGAVTITGKETGATLSYSVDGGTATSTYNPATLANGTHTVKVLQTDVAGNVSSAGSLTFTLDRVKPVTPTLALSADTGKSATDKITSNGAVTITGKETGATLSYSVDGGTASSTYNPAALANGSHTVKVLQTDVAGNVSSAGSLTFTLDRAKPVTPTLALSADTGKSATDKITSNGAVTITGKETGATLSYSVDGGTAMSTYNPAALANGTHTVKVLQTDVAGNVSSAGSLTFTLDRAKPVTPTLALSADTGKSATDKITSNGALTITGKETGATLSYSVDGGEASSTYNPVTLANGSHTVKVLQTDVAGNVSSAGGITFTLDRTAPTVTGVTTAGPDISGGSGTLTTGETARFSLALSEAVTITNASKLLLTLGNGEKAVYDAAASTATKLVFSYTVGLEETSSDLTARGISLNGATIRDAAGNSANLAGAVANPAGTLVIDGYTGTSGADAFKGTTGANTFRGLAGNDSYVVNHSGDRVIEAENQGTDTVLAAVSLTLSAHVENLTLTGSAVINGTGNGLANSLAGNAAANILKGGAGDDTLNGGLGKDVLVGGADKDTFVFDTALGTDNIDTIDDFSVKDDTILLDNDIFTRAGRIGTLAENAFHIGTKAHDLSDRIIYDSKTGQLWYDADGSGSTDAFQFATLDPALKLTAGDFDIIG